MYVPISIIYIARALINLIMKKYVKCSIQNLNIYMENKIKYWYLSRKVLADEDSVAVPHLPETVRQPQVSLNTHQRYGSGSFRPPGSVIICTDPNSSINKEKFKEKFDFYSFKMYEYIQYI
jgi:hypothetical protein